MTVCPLDYRYGNKHLKEIFSEEGKLERMLLVEAALSQVQDGLGMIPKGAGEDVFSAFEDGRVGVERVRDNFDFIKENILEWL